MKLLHPWRLKQGVNIGAGQASGSRSQSASAARGIAYHRRVYRQLERYYASDEAYLLVEPWFVQVDDQPRRTMRSPDAVVVFSDVNAALVVEVKMNWKDGRDEKLLNDPEWREKTADLLAAALDGFRERILTAAKDM